MSLAWSLLQRLNASTMASLIAAVFLVSAASTAWAQSPDAVVLVTTYADGRTTHHIVTADQGRAWTPLFPRIASWQPPAGTLAVAAINYKRTLVGGAVRVEISVLRGEPHKQEDAVARVMVMPGESVVADALRDHGVEPVTLSLTALAPAMLYTPQLQNKTAGLTITDLEVVTEPAPRYRISVKNESSKAALTFHVQSYRGTTLSLAGRQGHRDGRPVLAPGETYSFFWSGSSGPAADTNGWAPTSHDLIEITGVLWEDGTFEGEPKPLAEALMVYLGRRVQLARVIPLLEMTAALQDTPRAVATLKGRFEALTIEPDARVMTSARTQLTDFYALSDAEVTGAVQAAMREVKIGVLSDLDEAPKDTAGFRAWLVEITALYQTWLGRFARTLH